MSDDGSLSLSERSDGSTAAANVNDRRRLSPKWFLIVLDYRQIKNGVQVTSPVFCVPQFAYARHYVVVWMTCSLQL